MLRHGWLLLGLLCLGCHSLGLELPGEVGQSGEAGPDILRPLGFYVPALQANSGPNHLTQALVCLEKGDPTEACVHLAHHLDHHPEHLAARMQYAELLLRLERLDLARLEFERCIRQGQEEPEEPVRELLHCHSRLAAIAEAGEDDYTWHLHRGIGLYLLAQQWSALDTKEEELSVEGLLCKAAGELSLACVLQPAEARPRWYLHLVWSKLAQSQPAERALRCAREIADYSDLTPAEQRSLMMTRK